MSPVTASACSRGGFSLPRNSASARDLFALARVALAAAIKCLGSQGAQAEAGDLCRWAGRHG